MNELELLALVAGVSALAGLNLYLTVFATGLAVRMGWLPLPEPLQLLEILGHPAVLAAAGAMVLVEFVADKVPWVDSLWDGLHTLIRPLGAAWLSAGMASGQDPALGVVAALVGGGVALTTHTGKAGLRLAANTSPEPFSNTLLSLIEDAVVLAGLWLIAVHPWVAAGLVVVLVAFLAWLVPVVFRCLRMNATLIAWTVAGVPPADRGLPLSWREALDRALGATAPLEDAEPAFVLSGKGLRGQVEGAAVRAEGRIGWTGPGRALLLPGDGLEVHVKPGLWCEEVSWFCPTQRQGLRVRVARGRGARLRGWALMARAPAAV